MPIVPLYPRGEVSPRPLPDAATGELTALRDEVFGEAANGTQRRRLGPILDVHFAASTADITRHAVAQQDVYVRGVATAAIETSRAEAIADPTMMDNALFRAEDAARALHAGQPPEAVEAGVRAAGGSVIAGVIVDRLARNDPLGASLFRQYADRLDPADRRTLGAAAETLSNTLGADAWLHERSAALSPLTGAAALDAVNAASASTTEPSSVASSNGTLLDQDGIVGTRERLAEIEDRRSALTALNQQEFAANPVRLRANQAAIDTDTARSRAAVKAETDALYTDLRRHLTTGGPNGGPAITLPPATIMSRLTEAQRDAVTAQVTGAIEGRSTSTDPQTWHAIRRGLTGDDADERQRWASKNLVPFMDRLSTEAEAYATVYDLKDTAIKSGWLEVIDPGAFPIVASHSRSRDDVLPFTADEIAGMRRTLAEGTAEQRAAAGTISSVARKHERPGRGEAGPASGRTQCHVRRCG